jgi:hypothetical protein
MDRIFSAESLRELALRNQGEVAYSAASLIFLGTPSALKT